MGLIVLNVIFVILEPSFNDPMVLRVFRLFETFSVIVFTIEYLLRVWVSDLQKPNLKPWKARLLFIISAMAIIDLLAILPFYLPFVVAVDLRVLRMLRLMRLTRILKINRYTKAMTVLTTVLKNKKEQLLSSFFVALLLLVLSSVLMYNAEHAAQPEMFFSIIHTMWWAVATLTTVGYGDIYPVTEIGKILAALIAIIGIGIVAIPTGIIAAGFTEAIDHKEDQEETLKKYCPYCGKSVEGDE
jgi:voltage-gated potassium channel